MLISQSKKFIFLAYSKTGTSSVEDALSEYRSVNYMRWLKIKYKLLYRSRGARFKHMQAQSCKRLVGDSVWNGYFKFAFSRNPWDRVASAYVKHYHNSDKELKEGFNEWLQSAGVKRYISRPFSEFAADENGGIGIDFIGRYEQLERDFNHICNQLGIEKNLPHVNASPVNGDYRNLYTDEARDAVARWAKHDIEMFGYEF